MDSKFDNGVLSIMLPQRISAQNAPAFEKELVAIEQLKTAKEIILDAENLVYISSLGLRVILKLQKKFKDTPLFILNTSAEVYKIFDDTGFTSLFNVKRKLRYVDTSAFKLIAGGMYGSVYLINEEQILKVFHGIQSENDIQPVISAIRVAFVHGLPTIIPFEIVRTEKGIGMILELINSEMLSTLIAKNPQNLDKYIEDMIELSKTLANTTFEETTLRSRNEMLKSKLKAAADFFTPEEFLTVEKYIDAVPKRNTALHGDFHAKNLMMSDDTLMLIDMDEFSLGHPLWDVANLNFIYQAMVHIDKEIADDVFDFGKSLPYEDFYFKIIGCTFAQAEIIWSKFFNGYFLGYSEEDKSKILKLVEFYANLKFITLLIDICNKLKDSHDKAAKKVQTIRYFLAKLKSQNLDMLIKYLDLWK